MPTDPVYASVVTLVQALLDDQPGAWATETFLLPHINSAQRFVVQHLLDNEVPTMRVRTGAITIPANALTLTRASSPSLPVLLDAPMAIWEAPQGGTGSDYRPLPGPFPHEPSFEMRDDTLGSWNWQNGQVQFVGATSARDVMIDYVADLADMTVTGPNAAFIFPLAVDAIALLAASAVAITRGQTELASALGTPTPDRLVTGRAGFALSTICNVQKAPEQGPVQRRPYITRYRRPW